MSNSIMNRDLASVALSAREMLTNREISKSSNVGFLDGTPPCTSGSLF